MLFSHMETVRTYGLTLDLVKNNKGIKWPVAYYLNGTVDGVESSLP